MVYGETGSREQGTSVAVHLVSMSATKQQSAGVLALNKEMT